MGRIRSVAMPDLYRCYPLSRMDGRDERDIGGFTPVDERGAGLVRYLQTQALPDEVRGTMRTYLVRDTLTDGLVGYFSLKAGLVSNDEERDGDVVEFDTLPGVELANFAVNGTFRKAHPEAKGCAASPSGVSSCPWSSGPHRSSGSPSSTLSRCPRNA